MQFGFRKGTDTVEGFMKVREIAEFINRGSYKNMCFVDVRHEKCI